MRTLVLILLFGLFCKFGYSQEDATLTEVRNVYNTKGDYYADRSEHKKAILYYNMAYQKDSNDFFSVLKKAESFTRLKLFPQAVECYRIVFEKNLRINNSYRLKYALALLANNNLEEFKYWLGLYSKDVDAELKGENYLISSENRIKLYKDSTIILVTNVDEHKANESANLKTYIANLRKDANEPANASISIEGFNSRIAQPSFNIQKTKLYFVSDAPGGQGGMDLFCSQLVNNKWSYPENMGTQINTTGNETYPYIFNDSILYFASNEHKGFGGYDLFSVNLKDSVKTVSNLGNQINTTSDEYDLFLQSEGKSGYFCSNRTTTIGNGKIYQVDILNFKIKYAGYQARKKTTLDDKQINIIVNNSDEYNLAANASNNFEFGFEPTENYLLIVQKENITEDNILNSTFLTAEERERNFLNPPPLQKAEIIVPVGMRYQFAAGQTSITPEYKNNLKEIVKSYQSAAADAIDLTALVKELQLAEGDVYTIQFVKDVDPVNKNQKIVVSSLYINDKTVNIYGQPFFVVLPNKTNNNFTVQTDISEIEKNFSPKKYALHIDDAPVFSNEVPAQNWMLSLSVNTNKISDVKPDNQLSAKSISIIPGTEYILTLSKPGKVPGREIEVIVPLTSGVKYNLAAEETDAAYKKALSEFITGRTGLEPSNEELIDISVLSKELEVKPGENLTFKMLPAKMVGKQVPAQLYTSDLYLDGKLMHISSAEKYIIHVPFTADQKLNLQTDLKYVQENFEPNSYTMRLDTTSFTSEIWVDTIGLAAQRSSGYLSMSVNTDSIAEVKKQDQFTAKEVSIIPGKEYILTVSKVDAVTGKKEEIIVPLIRDVKYDFTSNPLSEELYKESLKEFMAGREDIETTEGTAIDIKLISKELQIEQGDEISFSLLPVRKLPKQPVNEGNLISSLFLDDKVVEFTQIQKYTINIPLNEDRMVNMQTNIEYLQENFEPKAISVEMDTVPFLFDLSIDTTGYSARLLKEKEEDQIKDPVFDLIVVNFNMNAYELQPDATKIIQEKVINILKGNSKLYVTIKGYTDALGDADYNKKLSQKRAESVKEFLINNGIGEKRIRTFSFGASQLLEAGVKWENMDESELKKHRKVEIVIYLPK